MKDIDIDGIDLTIMLGALCITIMVITGFIYSGVINSQKEQTKQYEIQLQIEQEKNK